MSVIFQLEIENIYMREGLRVNVWLFVSWKRSTTIFIPFYKECKRLCESLKSTLLSPTDNCLKLDDSGTLQPTECKQFKHGCPNKFYFSNTVWQCKYIKYYFITCSIYGLAYGFSYLRGTRKTILQITSLNQFFF